MRVKCLYNSGKALRDFEYNFLENEVLGRFGATGFSQYNELTIGKEYLVMGIIIFKTYQSFLVDDNSLVSACPCQLFEVIDGKVAKNWHFRQVEKGEDIYPFIQTIIGYPELVSDKRSYEKLIVEKDEESIIVYFNRKEEFES